MRRAAVLVLEDGRRFEGEEYGASGETFGEAVFCTAMTGYQETLTDPSYHRQVVVMTAPHIGNTGMNDEDAESRRIWVAGYVVRDPAIAPSNWRSDRSLDADLAEQGVVGISGIDTRALTRHLRERGAMKVGIFPGDDPRSPEVQLAAVRGIQSMAGSALVDEVSCTDAYVVEPQGDARWTVAAIDLGIKTMTPRRMAERGMRVHVLPSRTSIGELQSLAPDGVFLSNGPGDPATADHAVALAQWALGERVPLFGICLGHQVLGRALGLDTYKLRFGHRGVNQPVLDRRTGRVAITAHNHGFAVAAAADGPFDTAVGAAEVSHICLNDGVVEGLRCLDAPAFSVQYHPEAAAGPHDADSLFDDFARLMDT